MFIINFLTIVLTWKYADWRNWQKYQSTMLLFALGNLLYNFVYHDHFLWRFRPEFLNHHIWEVINTVIVFPLTALLFLSNFPENSKDKLIRILKFILVYISVEFLLLKIGRIEYAFGWNLWCSLAWDCVMFPILAIHYKKPLLAYLMSIILFFTMSWIFPFKLD